MTTMLIPEKKFIFGPVSSQLTFESYFSLNVNFNAKTYIVFFSTAKIYGQFLDLNFTSIENCNKGNAQKSPNEPYVFICGPETILCFSKFYAGYLQALSKS